MVVFADILSMERISGLNMLTEEVIVIDGQMMG
jgi:hypothetical protein